MINKFKHYTLADLGTVITGKTPSTSNPSFWNGNIPFITPKDLQTTKHIIKTERTITDYGRDSIKGCILPKDSISVSCIGNLGYVGKTTKESVTNQQINSIIPNNLVDSDFLYYLLKSMWSYFKHYEGQSTALSILNKTQFEKIQVNIPEDIDVQKKIAGVLSALDDKIELNNQINSNLEQQAQALFKSWFIDFEPFGGKMPDDWKIGKLSDIAELTNGKRPLVKQNSKNNNCIIPIVGASNIMGYTQAPLYTNKLLITGRVGTHGIVQRFNKPCWPSDNTLVLFSIFYEYVYQSLKKIDFSAMNRGSTQPLITQQDLKNYNIIVPSGAWLTKYEQEAGRLLALKEQRIEENAHLSELRDTILPKLISGEIDVSKVDIEQIVNNKD